MICSKICSKTRLKSSKSLLPVDVRSSKTSLLKLPKETDRDLLIFFRTYMPGNFNLTVSVSTAVFYIRLPLGLQVTPAFLFALQSRNPIPP